MAKVTGGLHSDEARGQIAKSGIFCGWKGIQRYKGYRKPRNPRTTTQQTNRGFMQMAVAAWKALSDEDKLIWEEWI